jgi:hypothetical protein
VSIRVDESNVDFAWRREVRNGVIRTERIAKNDLRGDFVSRSYGVRGPYGDD